MLTHAFRYSRHMCLASLALDNPLLTAGFGTPMTCTVCDTGNCQMCREGEQYFCCCEAEEAELDRLLRAAEDAEDRRLLFAGEVR